MTVGSQVKSCYFSIKQVQATLQILEQKSNHPTSIQAFKTAHTQLNDVKEDLNRQVQFLAREEPQYK